MNMNRARLGVAVVATLACVVCQAKVVWTESFANEKAWPTKWDMNGTMKFTFGKKTAGMESCLAVSGTIKNPKELHWTRRDTAWHLTSARIPIAGKAPKFAISFKVSGETQKGGEVVGMHTYYTRLRWYDAAGVGVGECGIPMLFAMDGSVNEVRVVESLPADAAFFDLRIGFDAPNLFHGDEVRFSDARFELLGADAQTGCFGLKDIVPPCVTMDAPEPSEDRFRPVRLRVEDPSGVDWATLKIELDGKEATAKFARNGGELLLARPDSPWTNGLHRVDVTVADACGNSSRHRKTVLTGRNPDTPAVRLRDDGTLLVGGEPFFPIGAYGVRPSPFDCYDIDRALVQLKQVGFNTVQTYTCLDKPEFLAAVRRCGLKIFANGGADARTVDKRRHNPDVIAWYIGDDTSAHYKPWDFLDRGDAMRSVDTTRPTCQADVIHADSPVDNYEDYAAAADIFLPEIYPVMEKTRSTNNVCVAKVISDMKRVARDNLVKGGGRVHATWPIIQNFCGWDAWHRYPDADEEYAMTFAAIIHGAKGITWYSYSGGWVPKTEKYSGFGFTMSEKSWTSASNLAHRISALVPVLLERDGEQPPVPSVTSGPRRDALGNPAVTGLLKRHGGKAYYFAVNSANSPVSASMPVGAKGKVEVLFEDRKLAPAKDGSIADKFKTFAVHIYAWQL